MFLSILIALAAMNTGANLLFLVLGLILSSGFVSWWVGRGQLDSLTVALELPSLVEARGGCRLGLSVAGRRGGSLRIEGAPFFPLGGIFLEEGRGRTDAVVPSIAPDRGVVLRIDVLVTSAWPLGLWERRRWLHAPVRVHVYPAIPPARPVLPPRAAGGAQDAGGPGEGGSLRQLRLYLPGDSIGAVHWRTSARMGELVVRQDHELSRPSVRIVVDCGQRDGARLEERLSRAAGDARDALMAGARVTLRVAAGEVRAETPTELGRLLRCLAEVPGGR